MARGVGLELRDEDQEVGQKVPASETGREELRESVDALRKEPEQLSETQRHPEVSVPYVQGLRVQVFTSYAAGVAILWYWLFGGK
jgi:hypothetical protein